MTGKKKLSDDLEIEHTKFDFWYIIRNPKYCEKHGVMLDPEEMKKLVEFVKKELEEKE